MNKGKEIDWYRLDNILKHDCQYYIIMGERSNGKTYATLQYLIDEFFKHGKKFAYIKRFEEDIKGKYMEDVFTHLNNYILETYNHHIKFYRGKWYVYEDGLEGKMSDCIMCGYAFSIVLVNRTKGTSYPEVDNIIFEEFMSIDCTYVNDELNLFLNLVSTIVRNRTSPKVFMLANTISKYSPYTAALGLKVHRQAKGSIITKTYTDENGFNTKFAIERTSNINVFDNKDNINKTVYNIFGNSGVGRMITTGDFETHAYPRKVDNFTFEECFTKGDTIISKKYRTSIVLRFEDYYYRIYLIDDYIKFISAYREIDVSSITSKNTTHVINGKLNIKDIVNVNELSTYDGFIFNELLNIIVGTLKQKDFVTITDDDGENVVNGFRISGIAFNHK